jgi:molybdenum cofactor cytidylyltransferase
MRFGARPVDEAIGGIVAHAVRRGDLLLKKGAVIGPKERDALLAAGIADIVVAMLDPDDISENVAAERLAQVAAAEHISVEPAFTGRSNLFAETAGVLLIDVAAIDAVNAIDEAVTIATLPHLKRVSAGEMVATVKIIPFAVPDPVLAAAVSRARGAVRVAQFRSKRLAVVSTTLPGLKPSVVDKTMRVLENRLPAGFVDILSHDKVAHAEADLVAALRTAVAAQPDIIIIYGASAITDRRDVIPAAIEAAGGTVDHFGMPVDPGNLLLIGSLGSARVIGAPGCARSPAENGFDWVLDRFLADVPVTRADIQRMGVGGLLMEIISRPQPRAPGHVNHPQVSAVVLAAGRSTRMGSNKLLATVQAKPILRHVVEAALASGAEPLFVVTGHEADRLTRVLAGLPITAVHNPHYADGLSTSLKTGLGAVPDTSAGALILLGDMPNVTADIINRLLAAFAANPTAAAVVPTVAGQRGNPVLIGRNLFSAVSGLSGDVGARRLLDLAGEAVIEVPIDDPAVLLDVDTPAALEAMSGAEAV